MGFRVWGLGFRVWGLGFRVWGLGVVWGLGAREREREREREGEKVGEGLGFRDKSPRALRRLDKALEPPSLKPVDPRPAGSEERLRF